MYYIGSIARGSVLTSFAEKRVVVGASNRVVSDGWDGDTLMMDTSAAWQLDNWCWLLRRQADVDTSSSPLGIYVQQ